MQGDYTSSQSLSKLKEKRLTGTDADNLDRYQRCEELEFWGDKLLGIMVSEEVFKHYSGDGPGVLTDKYELFTKNADHAHDRAGSKLYRLARAWGIAEVVEAPGMPILKDERQHHQAQKAPTNRQNKYTDVAEALIGAVSEDCRLQGKSEGERMEILRGLILPHYEAMGLYNREDELHSYASSPKSLRDRLSVGLVVRDHDLAISTMDRKIKAKRWEEFNAIFLGIAGIEKNPGFTRIIAKNYLESCRMGASDIASFLIEHFPQQVLPIYDVDKMSGHNQLAFYTLLTRSPMALDHLLSKESAPHLNTYDLSILLRKKFDVINQPSYEVADFQGEFIDMLETHFHFQHQLEMDAVLVHALGEANTTPEKRKFLFNSCSDRFLATKNLSLFRAMIVSNIMDDASNAKRPGALMKGVAKVINEHYDMSTISHENLDESLAAAMVALSATPDIFTEVSLVQFLRLSAKKHEAHPDGVVDGEVNRHARPHTSIHRRPEVKERDFSALRDSSRPLGGAGGAGRFSGTKGGLSKK